MKIATVMLPLSYPCNRDMLGDVVDVVTLEDLVITKVKNGWLCRYYSPSKDKKMTQDTFDRIYMYHMTAELINEKVGKLVWGMGRARTLTLEAEIDLGQPNMSFLTHSCIDRMLFYINYSRY